VFRRRPEWQRLRAVNFLYPLIPGAYLIVGICMIVYGVIWAPIPSIAALATILAGGATYQMSARRAA
jgi:hypothetical protein